MSSIAQAFKFQIRKMREFTSRFLHRLAKIKALFDFCEAIALIAKPLQINFSHSYHFYRYLQSFATFFCEK